MNKYFKETITRKALNVKHSLVDTQLETQLEAAPKAFFRNVCTPIPMVMNEELEKVIRLLGIPKNRFLYMAIESAIEEAKQIIQDIDVTEYQRGFNEAVQAQAQEEVA